jgi:hypothetical protein
MQQVAQHSEDVGFDDEPDEHISWDSATAVGDAVRGAKKKVDDTDTQEKIPTAVPPAQPAVSAPVIASNTLPITLMATVALLLIVIAVIATIVNSRLSDEGTSTSPYDNTTQSGGLFSHRPVPSALDGLWLGTDHSVSSIGMPVKYVFSSPDWLLVIGADASDNDTTMSESSYHYDGATLTSLIISSSTASGAPALAPASATSTLQRDVLTLVNGTNTIVLQRPQLVVGNWVSEQGTPTTYTFSNSGTITWQTAAAGGLSTTSTGSFRLTGNTILVGSTKGGTQTPMWNFTFDGGDLVLYPRVTAGQTNVAPIRLKRQ